MEAKLLAFIGPSKMDAWMDYVIYCSYKVMHSILYCSKLHMHYTVVQ